MAQIITVKNDLRGHKNKYRNLYLLWMGLLILIFSTIPFFGKISIYLFIGVGFIASQTVKKYRIYKSGYEGETKVKKILEKLPDDYTVLTDTTIRLGNQKSQIDNIIIGPNGIFVLEVKNLQGFIKVLEGKMWKQAKKLGLIYKREFYSPVKQVKTHSYRLSQFLKSMGYNIWVNGAVLFSHPDAKVNKEEWENIPIFSGKNGHKKLFEFIDNQQRKISPEDCQRITSYILGHQQTHVM